jgi:hypothetical protein
MPQRSATQHKNKGKKYKIIKKKRYVSMKQEEGCQQTSSLFVP